MQDNNIQSTETGEESRVRIRFEVVDTPEFDSGNRIYARVWRDR